MNKIFIIIIIFVSIISADNIYLKNGTVYENCKLVEENKKFVKVNLFKNNIKHIYIPKIIIRKIKHKKSYTSKKSTIYSSYVSSLFNLFPTLNFKSEIKTLEKELKGDWYDTFNWQEHIEVLEIEEAVRILKEKNAYLEK